MLGPKEGRAADSRGSQERRPHRSRPRADHPVPVRVELGRVYLGLAVKNEQTIDSLGPLIFPITMIGNTFVPTDCMPAWLRTIADWNPISSITAASRHLFGNPAAAASHTAWPLQHPIIATLLWSALLLAVFMPLSVHRYRAAE